MEKKDLHRMIEWLLVAVAFYAAALLVGQPQLETLFWKLGHVTVSAFVGYWIDRRLFGRYDPHDHAYTPRAIARAVVVAAAILGVAFGL